MSGAQVYVYYCQYSGRHALTTSCNLNRAPKRRTDGARVIDTQKDKVGGGGEEERDVGERLAVRCLQCAFWLLAGFGQAAGMSGSAEGAARLLQAETW